MTGTPTNPIGEWVGLARKAAADFSGWGLARDSSGLGAEEIPAGRGLVEGALWFSAIRSGL